MHVDGTLQNLQILSHRSWFFDDIIKPSETAHVSHQNDKAKPIKPTSDSILAGARTSER
jgi:hypothetical protein